MQLLVSVQISKTQLDDSKYSADVFVDLKKAFDTVDHNILLKELVCYGVRRIANECFASYLKNRKQFVSIGHRISSIQVIQTGVAQGSVLGPLPFLLHINDLNKSTENSRVYHFAYDANILLFNESVELLLKKKNQDLKNYSLWLKANKLSLNIKKTELIIFHPKKARL